jgi:hypothetical protein
MSSILNPILSSFGLGAPNPAAFSDASAVANQKAQAVNQVQTVVTTISTSLAAASALGAPPEYVDALKKKVADGKTLLTNSSNMTPESLQQETSRLQSEFTASQFKMTQTDYNTKVNNLRTILETVKARNTAVHADTTTSKGLLTEYDKLLQDTNTALNTLLESPPVPFINLPSSGSSGSAPPPYEIPVVLTPDEIQSTLDDLDDKHEQEAGSTFSLSRLYERLKRIYKLFYTPLFYIVVILSALLGGIILSNAYIEVDNQAVLNRLFYFIYGAIGYPAVLVYSCMPSGLNPLKAWPGKTPYWSAGIFPVYRRQLVSGGADMDSSMEASIKDSAGTITSSNETQPVTLSDRLFSYVLIDKKNPAPYQVKNRKNLFYYSGTALAANIIFLIHYGLL